MKLLARLLAVVALLVTAALPAYAAGPPEPLPVSVIVGQVNLSVTSTSSRVAFSSTAPTANAVTIYNAGAKDAFYKMGTSSVTALTTDKRIPAGTWISDWISSTYIAAISSGSDTTTLRIYQANGPINFGTIGAEAGGTVSVTQGTSPWVTADAAAEASLSSIDTKLSSQATAAAQTTAQTSLTAIAGSTAASATAAAQTTANASLATIATNTTAGTAGTPATQVQTVQGPTSGGTPVPVSSVFITPSSTTTRPNDNAPYVAFDTVCASTTAGSCVPFTWTGLRTAGATAWVFKANLQTSDTALISTTFVIHLYGATPTSSVGDNATFLTTTSSHFCDITITMNSYAFTDSVQGSGIPNNSNACMFNPPSGTTMSGYLETKSPFTPVANSTFAVSLEEQEN